MDHGLRDIIVERTQSLEPELKKQARKLNQKIIDVSFYHNAKNLSKIGEVMSDELGEFLLGCALDYDKTREGKFDASDNDLETLRGVWSAFSFLHKPEILDYLSSQARRSIAHRSFAHRYIFEILRLQEKAGRAHPLLGELYEYYDALREKLPVYELLRRIGATPADPYDFEFILNAVNLGYWFSNEYLGQDEKKHKFHLQIRIFAPFINDKTFDIQISNDDIPRARIDFDDDGVSFLQQVAPDALPCPDLLDLKPFIASVKSHFGIEFDLANKDKTALTAGKGLSRAKILAWLNEVFS